MLNNLRIKQKINLIFIIFISVFLFSAIIISYFINNNVMKKELLKNSIIYIKEKEKDFQNYINSSTNILMSIRKDTHFVKYLKDKNSTQDLEEYFFSVARMQKNFMQLRYIDKNGQEIIRVERDRNSNEIKLISKENLQNKKDRYYYKESLNKPFEKVWFSSLDLNIENEKIEIPFNSTLRAIYPIENNGKFDGILIINYYMEDFLKNLIDSPLYKTILFDKYGYIIKSYNSTQDWGYYQNAQYNIKNQFEEKFQQLINEKFIQDENYISMKLDLPLENELHILLMLRDDLLQIELTNKFYIDVIKFTFIGIICIFLLYKISKIFIRLFNKIEQEKEKFSNIFYNNHAMKIIINAEDYSILDANQSTLDFYGYTKDEFIKFKISDFKFDNSNSENIIPTELIENGYASFYFNHKIKNGIVKILDVNASIILIENKKKIVAILNDVTEKFFHENELIKLNYQLNEAQELANIGYWEYEFQNNKLWWSNQTYNIFNHIKNENANLNLQMFMDYVHPDDLEKVNEAYNLSVINKLPYKIEHRIILKDGTIKYVLENSKQEYDKNGNIIKSLGTVMDITDMKFKENQLKESNTKLNVFIDSNPIPTILLNVDGNVVRQNQSYIDLFGYSHQALSFVEEWFLNSHPYKEYREYDKNKWEILVEQASLNNGFIEPLVYKIKCIDNSLKDIIVNGTLYFDGLIVTLQDISFIKEQQHKIEELNKTLELKIKEQTKNLEIALEELNISQELTKSASISLDLLTNEISYYSIGFLDIFELNNNDVINLDKYIQIIHPEDRELFMDKYFKSLKNKEPIFEMTYRLLMNDGRIKWIQDKSQNEFDKDMKPIFTRCALQDVTEKYLQDIKLNNLNKNLEKKVIEKTQILYEEKERYENLMKLASDGIFIMSVEDGKLINYNISATNLLGYNNEEMQELTVFDWDKNLKSIEDYLDIAKNIGFTPVEIQRVYTRKDGSNYIAQINAVRIKSSQKDFIYSSVRDITKQIKQEEKLKELNSQLLNANEAKSQFLANMSHEIRTTLNGIMGLIDILLEENPTEIQKEYLNIIQNSSKNLKNIINDILDYSKIQAGKFQIINNTFSLNELVNNTTSLYKTSIQQKGLKFDFISENIEHNFLIGDSLRINQILSNILNNALKFTKEGSIKFKVYQKDSLENTITTIFEIEDTGIGISKKLQNQLFKEFTQGNESNTKESMGTGLGLTISKSLIELMNGFIYYESEEGVGTKFTIKIKLPYSDILENSETIFNKNYVLAKPKSALLIEDNIVNQLITKKTLLDINFDIDIANNGKEGVEKALVGSYDIIFMDIQMPIIDGYEATKKIREFNKNIPIIALSAAAMEHETTKAINSGMNNHLSKPIEKNLLIEVLNQYFDFKNIDNELVSSDEEMIMDIDKLSNKLEVDKDSLTIFYETFLKNYKNSLDILNKIEKTDDLRAYLNKLKDSSGELEFTLLFNRIKKLENSKDISINDVKDIKEIFIKTIEQINEFIKKDA